MVIISYTVLIVCIQIIIIVDYILILHNHFSVIISRHTHSTIPVFHMSLTCYSIPSFPFKFREVDQDAQVE